MHRHRYKAIGIKKNQEKMTPPKEHNKLPVTDLEEMEIHELHDKEFKIIEEANSDQLWMVLSSSRTSENLNK